MTETDFSEIGKAGAIEALYAESPFRDNHSTWFESRDRAYIGTAARTFLEGTDFDLMYFPLRHLGHKCVTAVTAELCAEMNSPRLLKVVLGLSSKIRFSHCREIWDGIWHAARDYGYSNVSLDLVSSRNGLSINLCATGECSFGTALKRPTAKSKDLICVTGRLGAAYLGLSILEKEKQRFEKEGSGAIDEKYKMFVGAYLKPELDMSIFRTMEEENLVPSFAYAVSDGLADAVKKLSRDSGLGAKIYAENIPFEGNSFEYARQLDIDPISAAMNGGQDWCILFTIPILKAKELRKNLQTCNIIGHLALPEAGTVLVTPTGAELPIRAQGWIENE